MLNAFQKDKATAKIRLLLFQAIMFAATTFIEVDYMESQGYPTRLAARRAFLQKVKLLHDFDCESHRVAVIQGVLLMAYGIESSHELKDARYGLEIAVSVAKSVGVHCDSLYPASSSPQV